MEYSPPPLFKQGASARAKVVFFALVSICLLLVDARLQTLVVVRQSIATVLYPLQMIALAPRDALHSTGGYFSTLATLQKEVNTLKTEHIANAQALQKTQYLEMENAHLRNLLAAPVRSQVKSVMGEILYDARDAFTRKIVLNRGTQSGVNIGQPVIDGSGIVGQVTRVFPFTSEVTLLTDKDQAIPVQVARNGLRSIAYGMGQSGLLDLHFMAANADIRAGDVLVTSGIDGVYPPGLNVAKVIKVESNTAGAFGRIVCQPLAGVERNKQLLILLSSIEIAPRPPAEDNKTPKKHGKEAKVAANPNAAVNPTTSPPISPSMNPTVNPSPNHAATPATTATNAAAAHPATTHAAPARVPDMTRQGNHAVAPAPGQPANPNPGNSPVTSPPARPKP